MQDDGTRRLEILDRLSGSGSILLVLTAIIVCCAVFPSRIATGPKLVASVGAAVLVLVAAYRFIAPLPALLSNRDGFVSASVSATTVCIGALLLLVAAVLDQRAVRRSFL